MLSVGVVLIGLSSGAAGLCPKACILSVSFVSFYGYLGDASPVAGLYLTPVLKLLYFTLIVLQACCKSNTFPPELADCLAPTLPIA